MSKHFIQNATIRRLGLATYRLRARSQFWRDGPRIFVNSVPKAGTHLITAELAKIEGLQNSYLHLDNRQFSDSSAEGDGSGSIKLDVIASDIATVRRGQYFSGHVAYDKGLEVALGEAGIKTIFVTRDPRAVLVSRYNYIIGLKRHWLHSFLTAYSDDPLERYRLLVLGHDGAPAVLSTADRLRSYLPWVDSPHTHTIRFEEMVGARGGRSDAQKDKELRSLLSFVGLEPGHADNVALLRETTSATFRKGQADGWREELPPEILELMTAHCGDVIKGMGYTI